jgi:TonB family protein
MCSTILCAQNSAPSTETRTTTESLGGIDVLSDIQGFDFGPYLQSVLKIVKQNWYNVIPQSAQGPRMKRGEVCIEFAILKGGKTKFIKLVESTGDIPMDRAAWAGIQDSRLSPLPAEYSGNTLVLRFRFSYNPARLTDAILQYRD